MTMTMSIEMPDSFSIELRSLLTGLLQREVQKRLGCRGRGAEDVKSHPFFRGIDWRVVFLQRLNPPLIPARGEVNAADAFDIGSFDDEDTKHIKLTEADQELYRNFPVVVSERWQHEIAETIFDTINHEADKAEMKRKSKNKLGYQEEEEQSDCILHGYVKRLGGTFTATWLTRYVRLYPNRLELWSDSMGKQPELIFMDQIEEVCEDFVQIKNEQCIVIKLYNHSKFVLTNSDEIGLKEWHVSLKAAHRESLDMMTTMAEKATKIYGTEIPLKHMGKRRQQLQQQEAANAAASGNLATNWEQKIIQKELQASSKSAAAAAKANQTSSAQVGQQQVEGKTISCPPIADNEHQTSVASRQQVLQIRQPSQLSSNMHRHSHRSHHAHRSHSHRHHHHHHAQTIGPDGKIITSLVAHRSSHSHSHHQQSSHKHSSANRQSSTASRSSGHSRLGHSVSQSQARKQTSTGNKDEAACKNQTSSEDRRSRQEENETQDVPSSSNETKEEPLGRTGQEVESEKKELEPKEIKQIQESLGSEQQIDDAKNADGTKNGTAGEKQNEHKAVLSPSESGESPESDGDKSQPGSSSSSENSCSSAEDRQSSEAQLSATSQPLGPEEKDTTVTNAKEEKPSASLGQHEGIKVNLAVSLENVNEQQEVLVDPSKRITSDNKQREQDLVAQYEKLNISARNSSSSIDDNLVQS